MDKNKYNKQRYLYAFLGSGFIILACIILIGLIVKTK